MKHYHTVLTWPLLMAALLMFLPSANTITYQVTGSLVNESETPVAGHWVFLYNSEDVRIASERTDNQGRFTLAYQVEPTSADPYGGPVTPDEFKLGSSYPNPFNPRTTIPFYAPENTRAVIAIYSILGQEMMRTQTDVNAGSHEIAVNFGGALSQGQYLLRVVGDGYSLALPMTFVSAGISSGTPGIKVRSGDGTRSSGSGTWSSIAADSQALDTPEIYRIVVDGRYAFDEKQIDVPARQNYYAGTIELTHTSIEVVEVMNPQTGRIWMDRNLGASRAATSSTDPEAYGDLYQWGRPADGHQRRTSATTVTLSSSDQPDHGFFIRSSSEANWDWRSPKNNNLWQGVDGVNNPCPAGYRLPTEAEWIAERNSWSGSNLAGAFASPLKLPVAGSRRIDGLFNQVGSIGRYWSSSVVSGTHVRGLFFISSHAYMISSGRASAHSVRCLKD